jgi:hypothetical protein
MKLPFKMKNEKTKLFVALKRGYKHILSNPAKAFTARVLASTAFPML